ncbi:MAG: DUF4956 domain-containing protein [Clostridia bacterium]|nr:DUF4956 domain-containing protein [Clostridia bacterium]
MLDSILTQTTATVGLTQCLICISVAILLGGIISFTHKLTSKTTPNFLLTLAVLPVLVQVVILLINGNLGTAFAVAGAFGLVRFRSMPGNSKEILSVFWAMAAGLGLGMGYVVYSIIFSIIVAILMIVLNKVLLKSQDISERKLKILIPENLDYEEIFNDIFEKYTNKNELRKVKTSNMGSMYELSYNISLKKDAKVKEFMDEIRCRNGNLLVMVERPELSEVEL